MQMTFRPNFAIQVVGLIAAICLPADVFSADPPTTKISIPPAIKRSISLVAKGATVLDADQIDKRECDATSNEPGLVRGDFDGDGREDFAVLLITRVSSKRRIWDGVDYRPASFRLALFLNDGKGGYRTRLLDKFEDQIPAAVQVSAQPSGEVATMEANSPVKLKNVGFRIHYCGKSSSLFAFVGNRLKEFSLSD